MPKVRLFLFVLTVLVVGTIGLFASYYARGYRFNFKEFRFLPNGLLVIKSEPDGASVFLDDELKTATNATISLAPATYNVSVKKDGYLSWQKRLNIDKEIVTQATASLFKQVPSLSPVTFAGANKPIISFDGTKIVYSVLPSKDTPKEKIGLWTLDTYSLPLGFSNDPKRITDGDMTNATYIISPDNRQIMLSIATAVYILDIGSFTPQTEWINVTSKKEQTLAVWKKERTTKNAGLVKNLPQSVTDMLLYKSSEFVFSPDQNMILYTATAAATLADNLIPQLPGASTQPQERNIQLGKTYIYDIKEDRNFKIFDLPASLNDETQDPEKILPTIRWMSTSRHLITSEPGKVSISDYDGTNKQTVYSGSYTYPFAFPFNNTTRLLILTNLGAENSTGNLYTVTIK